MRQRKIDDSLLLKMFRSGKLQREIAAFFKCTPVAVSKRLNKLLPQPMEILDKHDLSELQKRFVIEKARGKNNTQAALMSYECGSTQSAKVIGCNLMAEPNINAAIAELMEVHGLSRTYRVKKLKGFVDHPDPGIGLRSLDLAFKLGNDYPAQKNINLNVNAVNFTKFDLSLLTPEDKDKSEGGNEINHE
jgi:hypothetical protein